MLLALAKVRLRKNNMSSRLVVTPALPRHTTLTRFFFQHKSSGVTAGPAHSVSPREAVFTWQDGSATAPNVYNTQSGVPPREATFRAIDLGEVALRSRAR